MTSEEHKLLIENNIMLKQILSYITLIDCPNFISNNTYEFK